MKKTIITVVGKDTVGIIAKVCTFAPQARVVDVGCGGGFPSVPLAILFPDTRFTAVDSIGKKITVVRGVASALINSVTERARELDLSFITLEVRASNTAARSVYAKMGFNDVGVRPGYYEKPAEDAVIMTLYLKEVER